MSLPGEGLAGRPGEESVHHGKIIARGNQAHGKWMEIEGEFLQQKGIQFDRGFFSVIIQ
jgi:hypothetical protein